MAYMIIKCLGNSLSRISTGHRSNASGRTVWLV